MRSTNEAARRRDDAPQRWTMADDYLADPAVAPLRALVAVVVRRISGRREGRPGALSSGSERPNTGSIPNPRRVQTAFQV
jgi:hypothetical protein